MSYPRRELMAPIPHGNSWEELNSYSEGQCPEAAPGRIIWREGGGRRVGHRPPLRVGRDRREAAVWAKCKTPPQQAQDRGSGGRPAGGVQSRGGGNRPQGPRDYMVTEIPGVIAAGQRWK